MTRGNQRDKDRERAAKRAASKPKKTNESGGAGQNLKNKMESDAAIMRAKQQKALEAKAAGGGDCKK